LNPLRGSCFIVQLPELHSGCIVAFPKLALPPDSGVHTVSHDIRLTRDGHVTVPQNCLDHDVCHPELMQIGSESTPERMPTVPADRLPCQCRSDYRIDDVFKVDWTAAQSLEEIFLRPHVPQVRIQDFLQPWITGTVPLPRFPLGSPTLFRHMLLCTVSVAAL